MEELILSVSDFGETHFLVRNKMFPWFVSDDVLASGLLNTAVWQSWIGGILQNQMIYIKASCFTLTLSLESDFCSEPSNTSTLDSAIYYKCLLRGNPLRKSVCKQKT